MKIVKDNEAQQYNAVAHVTADAINSALKEFEKAVQLKTIEVLESKGFSFKGNRAARAFIESRVTYATVQDTPFLNLVFLDYKDFDNPGELLFKFSNEVKTHYNAVGQALTVTIG
jgi:hypothetical protein